MPPHMPIVHIAAVCTNEKCRHAWLTNSGLGGTPGVQFRNPKVYPLSSLDCPKFGTRGVVPDADYEMTETSAIITPGSERDRDLLKRVEALLSSAMLGNLTPEKAEELVPELAKEWRKYLQSPDGVTRIIQILIPLILALASSFKQDQPKQLFLPPEIIEALKKPAGSQQDSRVDNRAERRRKMRQQERQLKQRNTERRR